MLLNWNESECFNMSNNMINIHVNEIFRHLQYKSYSNNLWIENYEVSVCNIFLNTFLTQKYLFFVEEIPILKCESLFVDHMFGIRRSSCVLKAIKMNYICVQIKLICYKGYVVMSCFEQ